VRSHPNWLLPKIPRQFRSDMPETALDTMKIRDLREIGFDRQKNSGRTAHVVRHLAMALLVSCCAYCQCTLCNQSTCFMRVYSGSPNPSLSTFLADVEAPFEAINAATASMPRPKIALTAEILLASDSWLSSSVQTFGPAINGYMDLFCAFDADYATHTHL
jgi:hypothetical protein